MDEGQWRGKQCTPVGKEHLEPRLLGFPGEWLNHSVIWRKDERSHSLILLVDLDEYIVSQVHRNLEPGIEFFHVHKVPKMSCRKPGNNRLSPMDEHIQTLGQLESHASKAPISLVSRSSGDLS